MEAQSAEIRGRPFPHSASLHAGYLASLRMLVIEHRASFLEAWNDHFGGQA